MSYVELAELREQERQRADVAVAQLEAERQRNQAMAAKLREMGVDPEQL